MSIYGGFGLRRTESKYNWCLEQMLQVLSTKMINLIEKESEQAITSFKFKFGKIYCMMKGMEEHKYLPPKFSESVKKLADFVGIDFEFFEQYMPTTTIKGDSIMEHSNEKQNTRQDSQQTPPKVVKAKINGSQNSSLNNSQVKALRTPNSSSQRKRQFSSGNYQQSTQNIIINPLDRFSEATSQIQKIQEENNLDSNNENTKSNSSQHQQILQQKQIQSIDNSKLAQSDKNYDGKHKELINRVLNNIQAVHSLQYTEQSKLTYITHNPYSQSRNMSPTPDILNRRESRPNSNDKQTIFQRSIGTKNQSQISSNNQTFYTSNVFHMYDNKNQQQKNRTKCSPLYSPNIQSIQDESIKVIKKPSTRQSSERNQSVGPSFLSKNNSHNFSLEQSQLHSPEKKPIKNIRLKKSKISKQSTKEDQANIVINLKELNGEDNTGQTIFNQSATQGQQQRLPSLSPMSRNYDASDDLQGFLEGNFVYKEKETLQLACFDQKDQEPQKMKVRDVLLIEDQVKNEDTKII
ncbi:hypothetical protein ABPG74_017620 [Tetrahymena malaccensis]